jgi:hypothetical protein
VSDNDEAFETVDGRDQAAYRARCVHHARLWVNGHSKHNEIDDECIFDFSCCEPAQFTRNRSHRVSIYNEWAERLGLEKYFDD